VDAVSFVAVRAANNGDTANARAGVCAAAGRHVDLAAVNRPSKAIVGFVWLKNLPGSCALLWRGLQGGTDVMMTVTMHRRRGVVALSRRVFQKITHSHS
jgi:hypothetical protein